MSDDPHTPGPATDTSPPSSPSADDQALALALAVAVRTAAYYDPDNDVMRQSCDALGRLLSEYIREEGSVTIGVHSHSVFVGRSRVRTTVSTYGRFTYLNQLYERWGISTLTFAAGLSEAELVGCVLVLAREHGEGPEDLTRWFKERRLEHVEVDLLSGEGHAQAVAPLEAYAAAMQVGDEMREVSESGEPANVRRLRHVTQAVVDQILRDPGSLVALTTIKEFDRYLISHSTNVAVLAVVLGQRLGLSKSRLGELCLAAFLHDAGKLEVTPEVLNKPGILDDDEWEEMRRHPILAARSLLEHKHLTTANMRAAVVAFEHHLNFDLSGYPRTEIMGKVTLFGNIVAIADRYDALTTARVYRENNFTPYEALTYILANAGTMFDPVLVKLFAEIMGIYPPGTLVELSSGELAVVCESPAVGRPLDRPKVRVLQGGEPGTIIDVDVQRDGRFVRSVSAVLNPANQGQLPAVDDSIFATID